MHVDEARRECLAGAIDRRDRFTFGAVADERDAALGESDVGYIRRGAAAVINAGIPENRV
jgi:hypothetical protein